MKSDGIIRLRDLINGLENTQPTAEDLEEVMNDMTEYMEGVATRHGKSFDQYWDYAYASEWQDDYEMIYFIDRLNVLYDRISQSHTII